MSAIDRRFDDYRRQALAKPVTRATHAIFPEISLPGNIHMALSLNK